MKIPNEQFDFMDWEKAFARYYERQKETPETVLVISTHHYTSGYWIEAKPGPVDRGGYATYFYNTLEEVQALEQRVRDAREAQKVRGKHVIALAELVT